MWASRWPESPRLHLAALFSALPGTDSFQRAGLGAGGGLRGQFDLHVSAMQHGPMSMLPSGLTWPHGACCPSVFLPAFFTLFAHSFLSTPPSGKIQFSSCFICSLF